MKGNIIVGQSGGPTAAINSSLAGVYRTAIDRGAKKVYGMRHGIQGLLNEDYIDLSEHIQTDLDVELLKRYYDYVDTLREAKLRPILEKLLPVLAMSAWGAVPDGLDITFPPLWTPTAKEVAEIAKTKSEAIVSGYQVGLLNVDTAQKELKKLAVETGMFVSISEEEIAANAG